MTPGATNRKLLLSGLSACALGVSLLLCGCGASYHPYQVAGSSMLPLLRPGDRIFVDQGEKARSDLHDGDVIVVSRNDRIVLKRIVAMPGETISGIDRKVFRNGKQVDEPYLSTARGDGSGGSASFASRTVGPGELFVMGDNRDLSLDSRTAEYGPVRVSDVVGQYRWTYWPSTSDAK